MWYSMIFEYNFKNDMQHTRSLRKLRRVVGKYSHIWNGSITNASDVTDHPAYNNSSPPIFFFMEIVKRYVRILSRDERATSY